METRLLWAQGEAASRRRSYVEGCALRRAANQVRMVVDLPFLLHEEPTP